MLGAGTANERKRKQKSKEKAKREWKKRGGEDRRKVKQQLVGETDA